MCPLRDSECKNLLLQGQPFLCELLANIFCAQCTLRPKNLTKVKKNLDTANFLNIDTERMIKSNRRELALRTFGTAMESAMPPFQPTARCNGTVQCFIAIWKVQNEHCKCNGRCTPSDLISFTCLSPVFHLTIHLFGPASFLSMYHIYVIC